MEVYLTVGFQKHIYNYSLWSILNEFISQMEKSDRLKEVNIDYLIKYVLSHLFDEILGRIEEEKEVNQIGKKGVEMRKNKA